jgi:hypothetical protein
MEKCFQGKDLNPQTCQFNAKCKEGYVRDINFKCVKDTKKMLPNKSQIHVTKTRKVNSKKVEEMIDNLIHKIQNNLSKAGLILRSINAIKTKITPELKPKYKQMVKMYNEKYNREVSISPNHQNKSITPIISHETPPHAPIIHSPPREQVIPKAPSHNKPKKSISLYLALHGALLQNIEKSYKLINYDKLKDLERIQYIRFGEDKCPNVANRYNHISRHYYLKHFNKIIADKKELFAEAILSYKNKFLENDFNIKNLNKYVQLEKPENTNNVLKFIKRVRNIKNYISETIYEKGKTLPIIINKIFEGKDINENKNYYVAIIDDSSKSFQEEYPVYKVPNKFKIQRTIKQNGRYLFKLQDLLEHLMSEGYTDITLYDSSCNGDEINNSNKINYNVLVLCQRKTTLDGEPIVNNKMKDLANRIIEYKYNNTNFSLNIEYVSDLSDKKGTSNNGIVNHDIKFGNEPITSETFEQNAYDLIIMNTCPLMFMDYNSIYKYLKPGGILATSIYFKDDTYKDGISKTKILLKHKEMYFKNIDPTKFKNINFKLLYDAVLFQKI